jgi:DNA mismatch repair protein MutS
VLYRVGEFYEVLRDDAIVVSRALGIQLTRRRQKDAADVPMCGIPAATAGSAVNRLLAAGHKVALSEQPADPSEQRPLRLMTPATSVDPDVLAEGRANNLAIALTEGEAVGFAWIDLSTGETGTCMVSLNACGAALARIAPSEILVVRWPEASDALAVAVRGCGVRFSDLPRAELKSDEADGTLATAYGGGWRETLRGFSPPELGALAALLDYVRAVVGQCPRGCCRRAVFLSRTPWRSMARRCGAWRCSPPPPAEPDRCSRCWTGRSRPQVLVSSFGSYALRSPTPTPFVAGWP